MGDSVQLPQHLHDVVDARWANVRAYWQGMKLAKASVISVTIGLLLFLAVPQAQDLFLEVRGSAARNATFWAAFYFAVLAGWVLPVYLSASWVLWQFRQGTSVLYPVSDEVRGSIPALLALLCLGAVLVGQVMSLWSAPTIVDLDALQAGSRQASSRQVSSACAQLDIKNCGMFDFIWVLSILAFSFLSMDLGTQTTIFLLYCVCGAAIAWFLVRYLLRRVRSRPWRITFAVLWWTITIVLVLPITVLALLPLPLVLGVELERKLNLGHLFVLPLLTIIIGWGLWRTLGPRAGQPARAERQLAAIFFSLLALSLAIVLLLLVLRPVDITTLVYRALMVPFLLGLFVPIFTYLSYWSARWQAPLVITLIVTAALSAAYFGTTNDVRTITASSMRPTLEQSVARWAAANDCDLRRIDTERECPQPIIVAAAGGASRAAFLVGSFLGQMLDEVSVDVREGFDRKVDNIAFTASGDRIVAVVNGTEVGVWDLVSGGLVTTLKGHKDKILSIEVNRDGRRVLTLSEDGSARLWETDSGKPIASLKLEGRVHSVVFSSDGHRVLTGLSDGTARLWESETGKPLRVFAKHDGAVLNARFSADGRRVVSASADWSARIWDTESGSPVGAPLWGHRRPVTSAEFSADDRLVLTSSEDGTARLWNAQSGSEIATLKGASSGLTTASFSPDGQRVVTLVLPSEVRLWDARTGHEVLRLDVGDRSIGQVTFSRDSRRLVTGAHLWDASNGRLIADLGGGEHTIFSSDGARIARIRQEMLLLFNAEDGNKIVERSFASKISSVAFSMSGARIAVVAPMGAAPGPVERYAFSIFAAPSDTEILSFDAITS